MVIFRQSGESLTKALRALAGGIVVLLTAVQPMMAQYTDADGCHETAPRCVQLSGEWDGDTFISRYTNNCGSRIYIRWCNFTDPNMLDYDECGADGLMPGQTKTWRTYGGTATGSFEAEWVGSMEWTKDWVCASNSSGWDSFGR